MQALSYWHANLCDNCTWYVGTDYDLPVAVVSESWCDMITTVLCTILLLQMLSCEKTESFTFNNTHDTETSGP